ncbi:MAG: ArsR family transcriptional regulator [Sphingobacteriales bacterium]|nr:MAG: ArsR family transcriptional regulator [Sphingobacteriales bacterium]
MRRDVYQAIADPTRRAILGQLAERSLNVDDVAAHFSISRPAISKHIRILTECGLISIQKNGRERICAARLQKLGEVSNWLEQYSRFWTKKLDALGAFLEKDGNEERSIIHLKNKK